MKVSHNGFLLSAIVGESIEVVKNRLKDKGVEINATWHDGDGWTPLMYAVHRGAQTVKLVLDAGAEVDRKREDGDTPLMIAAEGDYPGAVKCLLDAGADISIQDQYGRTALERAEYRSECEKLLKEAAVRREPAAVDTGPEMGG